MDKPYVKYEARITCGWKHIAIDQAQGYPMIFLLDQGADNPNAIQILVDSAEKFEELWEALRKLGR